MTRLPANKAPALSEEAEQIAFVQYLEARGLTYSAIPNSTYSPHMSVKARNKRMGVRPGVPDMVVVLPGIGLAWVELKRTKGGVVSDFQKQWVEALNSCPGNEARVCRGAEEAIRFIEDLSPSGYNFNSIF